MAVILYTVIPCYNEQEVLPETSRRMKEKYQSLIASRKISPASRIVFVDDGSRDRTWEMIAELHQADNLYSGIKLTRNRGHQNALLCGLMTVYPLADAVISMDADLQDDIGVIDGFLEQFAQGCDVVYGVRSDRESDTFFKRFTAEAFYKMMRAMGADVVFNHADCRLMSRRALEALSQFEEVNLFLRGLVPMVGYRSGVVTYARHERFAGESKYPLRKMLALAFEGITSLSTRPVKLISLLGAAIFGVSLLMLIYFFVQYFLGNTVQGWASLAVSVWALGGLQLLAIGVIGEYVGKVYLEAKARPRYLVECFLNADTQSNS